MGEFPMMTPWGTFIINGSERVIVTQIIRSAGAFFGQEKEKKSGQLLFSGQIIPTRGAWIEFETGTKLTTAKGQSKENETIWYAKLDRSNRIPLTTFIRALGVRKNKEIVSLFLGENTDERSPELLTHFKNTFKKDETMGDDQAIKVLYSKLRPDEKTSADEPPAAPEMEQMSLF